MQYFGGKLSAAQLQVAGWVGSVRRSLQGAIEVVWGTTEDKQEEEEVDGQNEKEEEEEEVGDAGGRFQRAFSPLRSFARRSRRSLRRFSLRSRQTLQRRNPETCSAEINSYHTNIEDKDTDALIDGEPDQQDEVHETPRESDSPQTVDKEVPNVSPEDPETTQLEPEPELPAFPESITPLLDTSAMKSRVALGKRRSRSRPSRSFRVIDQSERSDWRAHDTTALFSEGEKTKEKECDSDDEQPKPKLTSSLSQRVPVFPGLSPASLIAQLKKRTPGGGTGEKEEREEDKAAEERETENEEVAPSASQLSRSPRSAANLAGAARVLPPIGGKDAGGSSSPAWLKELKSKKRLSQPDGDV